MTDTNVTISAKRGCSDTGITEELASRLYNSKGSNLLAIVEFKADTVSHKLDGSARTVNLVISSIEPVVDGELNGQLDEHVRTIQQALFRNRAIAAGSDEALPFGEEDGPTPAVADIIQQGQPFVVNDEDDTDDLDDDAEDEDDQDAEPDDDLDDEARDPYTYVHSSDGAAPGADTACGLRATVGKSLHMNKDHDEVGCPECLSALDATTTATTIPNPFAAVPS